MAKVSQKAGAGKPRVHVSFCAFRQEKQGELGVSSQHDGGSLEVQAPGRVDSSPAAGAQRQIPYFCIAGERLRHNRLILVDPLPYPVPAGTRIVSAYNAIQITGSSRNLRLRHLTIGGNRPGILPRLSE